MTLCNSRTLPIVPIVFKGQLTNPVNITRHQVVFTCVAGMESSAVCLACLIVSHSEVVSSSELSPQLSTPLHLHAPGMQILVLVHKKFASLVVSHALSSLTVEARREVKAFSHQYYSINQLIDSFIIFFQLSLPSQMYREVH